MKKQWCIPLLFLGVLCSAFPLEFRLDGGPADGVSPLAGTVSRNPGTAALRFR